MFFVISIILNFAMSFSKSFSHGLFWQDLKNIAHFHSTFCCLFWWCDFTLLNALKCLPLKIQSAEEKKLNVCLCCSVAIFETNDIGPLKLAKNIELFGTKCRCSRKQLQLELRGFFLCINRRWTKIFVVILRHWYI